VATAAHTGARKGERMRIGDVDFAAGIVSIQERKRAHGRRTTRRVPLSTALASILADWLKRHPGGDFLIAQAEEVERSKKRSQTIGHLWNARPGAVKERQAGVRKRQRPGILPLTEDEAGDHQRRTWKGDRDEWHQDIH
jgi:integrase